MLTEIRLYGALGKRFGRKWKLNVHSPADVVRALDALRPGFSRAVIELNTVFRVRVGHRAIGAALLEMPNNGKCITITPVIGGAVSAKAIGEVILGVVLIAAGLYFNIPYLTMLGVSLALGGVAALLAQTPSLGATNDGAHKSSYAFGGAVNTIAQGEPVPICYGDMVCGSAVGSAGIESQDIVKGSTANTQTNSGGGRAIAPIASNRMDLPDEP